MSSARDRLARDRSEARRHPVAVVQIGDARALVIDYDDASKPYPPDTTSDDWDRVDEWPPVDDGSRARARTYATKAPSTYGDFSPIFGTSPRRQSVRTHGRGRLRVLRPPSTTVG